MTQANGIRLVEAQELLAIIDRAIAKDEHETRERIVRCTGLDGDPDFVSSQEWQSHHRRMARIRAERVVIINLLANMLANTMPAPVVVL